MNNITMGMRIEEVEVNGDVVKVQRLTSASEELCRNDFTWSILGEDVEDEAYDTFYSDTDVIYKDDYDTGKSYYQVVGGDGHGDGSGTWTPVQDCPYL